MKEQIDIDIVHTGSDEHVLTAFDSDGNPICTLLDPDQGVIGDITDGMDGERTACLRSLVADIADYSAIHAALYQAAAEEWPG